MINCGLQDRYRTYEAAKKALSIANRLGQPYKGRAMSLLNKHRNALRWAQRGGRKQTYTPNMETTVCGIPCGVLIENWGSDEDFSWRLLDRNGYIAEWLENKMTQADVDKLIDEMEAEHEYYRNLV